MTVCLLRKIPTIYTAPNCVHWGKDRSRGSRFKESTGSPPATDISCKVSESEHAWDIWIIDAEAKVLQLKVPADTINSLLFFHYVCSIFDFTTFFTFAHRAFDSTFVPDNLTIVDDGFLSGPQLVALMLVRHIPCP